MIGWKRGLWIGGMRNVSGVISATCFCDGFNCVCFGCYVSGRIYLHPEIINLLYDCGNGTECRVFYRVNVAK